MDVHDAPRIAAHEVGLEQAHETGQADKPDLVLREDGGDGVVEGRTVGVIARADDGGGNAMAAGALESVGTAPVGEHQRDAHRELTALDRVDDRL